MKKTIRLNSPEDTTKLAEKVGTKLRGGECIELVSDLGGGKTTFVRGLVKGMGSKDNVSSPTFTIGKLYKTEKLSINHFDFYRLQEAGLVAEELAEALEDKSAVVIVEWAGTVSDVLPKERVIVEINKLATEYNVREMTFQLPKEYKYIEEALR